MLFGVLGACSRVPTPAQTSNPRGTRARPEPSALPESASAVPSSPSSPEPSQPTLLITDPELLLGLEHDGLALGTLLEVEPGLGSNDHLAESRRFAPVVQELEDELARATRADKLAGVDVGRFSHRLFDRRFLRLPQARFALAGIVNRPDRAAFAEGSCGELRLIYRLQYRLDEAHASKLPMTIGVELPVPRGSDGCRSAQQRWVEPRADSVAARIAWLRAHGPLQNEALGRVANNARVVLNLQLVRWPSTVRPDLGGHAEYLLRAFRADAAGVLRPEPLENTIDAKALRTPAQQRAFATWLDEQASRIDGGTPLLPEPWLAKRALSVTPRGLHRLANRPFSAALDDKLLAGRDFGAARFVKSSAGLLRRLDELSCQGCHEARSVAGFHLLGEDSDEQPPENALALPVSPQVLADLPRRLRVARAMLDGNVPDFAAPFAERPSGGGKYGEACALADDASFAGWQCEPGLACSATEAGPSSLLGQCLPSERRAGDACERGAVGQARDPLRDRMSAVTVESCLDMVCNRSGVGFPGGMCTATCGAPGTRCGAIAILDSFNACLARGEPFIGCIRGNVTPAGLRACDADNPCRDDYVCAKTPHGGACLPPYFVFQLRVDGHSSGLH